MRIDEYEYHPEFRGALSADLAQFYNGLSLEDVWTGRVSAGYVLGLIEHLHLNPHSRVRMIALGGDVRWIGWDANADIAAARFDQLTQIVAGFGKSKANASNVYPRPGGKPDDMPSEAFAGSVDDFEIDKFMAALASR